MAKKKKKDNLDTAVSPSQVGGADSGRSEAERTNTVAAWTNQWLRELSWGYLTQIIGLFNANPPETGIGKSRMRRANAELARRKKEGLSLR